MKPLPRSVPIKGVKWKVRTVLPTHKLLGGDCGTYSLANNSIYIDKTMSLELQWATLFHEWLHVVTLGHEHFDLCEESPVESLSGEVLTIVHHLEVL